MTSPLHKGVKTENFLLNSYLKDVKIVFLYNPALQETYSMRLILKYLKAKVPAGFT